MSASSAIQQLRQTLLSKGFGFTEADEIADAAAAELDYTIVNILNAATVEAAAYGIEMKADDFVSQMKINRSGETYNITTNTGKTDFSNPPFPLLPYLLKNAKTSKDGHRYKTIPIRKDTASPSARPMGSIEAAIQIDAKAQAAKEARYADRRSQHSSPSPTQAADIFAGTFSINWPSSKEVRDNRPKPSGNPEFRTASDKQNPSTSWVLPAQDRDMTRILADINSKLQSDIASATDVIVKKYGG